MTIQPFQPPHPHDPTTSPRSWTDAFPVSDRDADALDAWLDNSSASVRAGDAPSPADDHHSLGQNGQTAAAGEDATFPLTAAARHIHARLETAQRIGVPDVPEDAIWEKIMSSHLALDHTPATRPASTRKRRRATTATTASPRPVRKIAGSHPSISIVLFAALLIAIIAGFRGMNGSGPPPSPTADDTLAIAANASPAPVTSNRCAVKPLTDKEVARLREARLAAPEPAFLPTTGTAPQLAASAAITTFDDSLACTVNAEQSRGTFSFSPWTDNLFAEYNLRYPTDSRIVIQEQTLAATRQLSPVLVDMDPTHYIVDANDPAMQQFLHRQASSGGAYVLLPQDFVVLADGRIGVPVKLAFPGGNQTFTKDDYRTPQAVQFAIFANVDGTGKWLLDQSIPLCTWKCDQYYADLQTGIDRDRQWLAAEALRVTSPVAGTPIPQKATPAGTASPASAEATASPVAADPWLQPITAAECATPTTTGRSEVELIAVTSRWYLACGNERNNVQDVISFFSADLLARHPELLKGQYTLQAADIDSSKAVSSALASKNIQLLEQGVPGADDDTTRTSGFYEVFLPQNTVVLSDGRIAIPFTSAFPDPASFTRAKTSQAADPKAPQAAGALVFVKDGDTWKIDQFGAICITNCDGVWSEQETHVGTPSPSNDELATASAEAAKLLPIPPESCMVPTATASASDLPNRSYNRLMMPTTNKADGAADAARNVIACSESVSASTPTAIQEQISPLMTDRLQTEIPANGDDSQFTMAQINGARYISSYLEEQTTYKPFERAAEGVHDAPPDVWPGKFQGASGDLSPGWYPIVLPENSIQFPDGRIGVPFTLMVTSDDLWKHLASEPSSQSNIYIFSLVDGTWQLDESLPLCVGDCAAFWQEAMGTPASIVDDASLQPITADDCAVPTPGTGAQPQLSPREDRPISVPNPSDSKAVASIARDYLACSQYGAGNSLDPFMTDRFQSQVQGALANHDSSFQTREDITAARTSRPSLRVAKVAISSTCKVFPVPTTQLPPRKASTRLSFQTTRSCFPMAASPCPSPKPTQVILVSKRR